MTTQAVDEILEHFGTKGMKWGVRKLPRTSKQLMEQDFSEFVTKNRPPDEATFPSTDMPMDVAVFLSHYGDISLKKSSEVDNILEHFGTRGMKWGVRKAGRGVKIGAKAAGSVSARGSKAVGRLAKKQAVKSIEKRKQLHANRPGALLKSPRGAKGRTVFRTGPKHLTDEELHKRISRLEMEKKYLDLNNRELKKGKKAVGDVLASSGKTVGKTAATAVLTFAVKNAFEKGGGKMGKEIAKDIKVKHK